MRTASYRAGCQKPANNSPARQNIRAQHFIGWMNHATYITNEVTAQWLALSCGQILPLKPVLVTLLLTKPNLQTQKARAFDKQVTNINVSGVRTFGVHFYPWGHEQQLGLHVRGESTGQKLAWGSRGKELQYTWGMKKCIHVHYFNIQ